MRRSSELRNLTSANYESYEAPLDQEEIGRHLGELVRRHHELSLTADGQDTETLHDMKRIRTEIRMAQFSLEHPEYHAA